MVIVPVRWQEMNNILVITGCFEDLRKGVKKGARSEIWDNNGEQLNICTGSRGCVYTCACTRK